MRLTYLRKLEKRIEEVTSSIEEQGKLTPELKSAILKNQTLQEVEDLYLPYKQKKKTRASVAREKDWSHWRCKFWSETAIERTIEACSNFNINLSASLLIQN